MPETLAEKMKQNRNPTILIAQLFTEDYFEAIGNAIGDMDDADRYERVYLNDIPVYGEGSNLVAQTLYEAAQTPDKYRVFFRTLIEPFIAMKGVHHYDARYNSRK